MSIPAISTAQVLRLAASEWRAIHEAIHGLLDRQTAETVNEAMEFLITVSQTANDHASLKGVSR